jgi:multidrug efflux pump subunit AcrB
MRGAVKWMAGNHVAANLLMMVFLIGGLVVSFSIKQEVFPEIELDIIKVVVPYPGAGPEEVEEGIILKLEERLSSISEIKEVRSTASEGVGSVTLELIEGEDIDEVLQDVKVEVDRITTFPEESEKPIVSKMVAQREVISVVIYGDATERTLREYAEDVQDELLSIEGITQVDLTYVRPYEISVEIPEETLLNYGITLQQVAEKIRQASMDLPAGSVKSKGGEVLIRTKGKRYTGLDYEGITIIESPDGTEIKLGDLANVKDSFAETDKYSSFDGKPSIMIKVFRVGDQKPDGISTIVKRFVKTKKGDLPLSLSIETWNDLSEIFTGRKHLLIKNAMIGLVLVLIILGMFLQIRLALWVMLGLPISFLGAILLMPPLDVSINMISLFAFILVLGIVVDDAIVVGESIYEHRRRGKSHLQAAVDGALEVTGPVVFAILSTVAAFLPLLYVSGRMGKIMEVIPLIIIPVLAVSLVECLLILPAHLSFGSPVDEEKKKEKLLYRMREKFNNRLDRFIGGPYTRALGFCIKNKAITVASSIAILLMCFGLVGGGIVKFHFMPDVESDIIQVALEMPVGTVMQETTEAQKHVVAKGLEAAEHFRKLNNDEPVLRNIFSLVGSSVVASGPDLSSTSGGHLSSTFMFLVPSSQREASSTEIAAHWRKSVADIPGVENINFQSSIMSFGSAVDVRFSHKDFNVLNKASEKLKETLSEYNGVYNIQDSYSQGKREISLTLKPEARTLGITESDLATQVRSAFFGAEALRLQRGRNEVKVMVRYPEKDRKSLESLDTMFIRTPSGDNVPLSVAAYVSEGKGFSSITRTNRRRVINVTADVDAALANAKDLNSELKAKVLPAILEEFPGLTLAFEGEDKERTDSMQSLLKGFAMAMFVIFVMLAIPFRSYSQPLIIMAAIPFGVVGGILGHLIMGYSLSILSMFGIVALSGVVVNDSLLLIDHVNNKRAKGMELLEAVMVSGKRRFRPILLTSLTTFFGLAPMILETDMQARFLIPMAISLAFGILFATFITLLLIPTLYMILETMKIKLGFKAQSIEAE